MPDMTTGTASAMSPAPVSSVHPAKQRRVWANVANALAFQLGWFACVLGAANDAAWLGVSVVVLVVGVQVALAPRPGGEAALAGLALLLGATFETALIVTGGVIHLGSPVIPPAWMLALWPLFAGTLNLSMGWLKGRWMLAALLGGLAGPLSYWAGARLGALQVGDPVIFVAVLSTGWAVLTPLLIHYARRLGGDLARGPAMPSTRAEPRGGSR